MRLERSCERAALEHLADKAKKLRLEKRRDRYAVGRKDATDMPPGARLRPTGPRNCGSLMTWGLQRIPSLHRSQVDPFQTTTQSASLIWAPSPYIGNRCVRGLTVPIYGHCQNMYSEYLLLMPLYGHMHAVYIFSFYDISIYGHITRLYGVLSKPQPNLTWHCIVCLSPGYIGIQTDRHKPISAYMGIKGIQADRWLIKVL